ncbi:hypothetical protein CTheo_8520 [Ceratobasidium theobromae]|uniref:Uncharacterized protein n=1 Tax=Ceratobasidium theobromae TaxID=1582974 RepID=A0A5N5Q9F5_9AGAM|nr:hypothetical protein CTheo_8520 [Ceratobasidium theobromae]
MSALSNMMCGGVGAVVGASDRAEDELTLGGVEAVAQTWGIVMREKDRGEVRKSVERPGVGRKKDKGSRSDSDWHIFPREVHPNLPGTRITIRREVSAWPVAESGSDGASLGSATDAMYAASSPRLGAWCVAHARLPLPTDTELPEHIFRRQEHELEGSRTPPFALSDGLGHGLGSLKREIVKVRPSAGSGERRFDDDALFEVDEELPPDNVEAMIEVGSLAAASREDDALRSAEPALGSDPSTVPDIVPLASHGVGDPWMGGGGSVDEDEEDHARARENSRFDDLVIGLMGEEKEDRRVTLESVATATKKKNWKKRS